MRVELRVNNLRNDVALGVRNRRDRGTDNSEVALTVACEWLVRDGVWSKQPSLVEAFLRVAGLIFGGSAGRSTCRW
jgi:hypothetical protein